MYRQEAGKSVLQGVLSGAYAGGRREVDVSKLPASTRQRLASALAGRSAPTPILYRRTGTTRSRATWAMLGALVGFVLLTTAGFGDVRHPWALEPRGLLVPWCIAGVAFAIAILWVARRRSRLKGETLPEGKWLLPLDIVDVPPATARYQVITVTPLGDARDASIHRGFTPDPAHRKSSIDTPELVIALAGGASARFPLRSESEGEVALLQLEHSQRLLEDLTYGVEKMDRALTSDAFFDLRVDGSWASVAPDRDARAEAHALERQRRSTFAAVGLGVALGTAGFFVRNDLSDHAMYHHAQTLGTVEAFDAYVAKGRRHVEEARAVRTRILEDAEAKRREEAMLRENGLPLADQPDHKRLVDGCTNRLDERAAPGHPEVATMMRELVARAEAPNGRRIVPIRVTRNVATPPEHVDVDDLDLGGRERVFGWAFERIFSEVCPATILRFVMVDVEDGTPATKEPGIDLSYSVAWRKAARPDPGPTLAANAIAIVFDVAFRPVHTPSRIETEKLGFRLTMPVEPTMTVRDRSLFVVTNDTSPYTAMASRAFDRLYDEICTWVFSGDPRVPLRADDPSEAVPAFR